MAFREITLDDMRNQWSKDPEVLKKCVNPHVVRDYKVVPIRELMIGQIFYIDLDNFVFFFSTNKRYVEKFEDDKAIVQILHKNADGSLGFNIKAKYNLDYPAYIITGEHISIY